MAKAATTRERILDHGLAIMSRAGLSGVTLGTLAEDVGMSKSGLFAHFKSKEDVQIALLDYTSEFGRPYVVEPAMSAPEGRPRLKALVEHWFGWAPRSGLPGGCPVAAGMFEYDDLEGPVRDKLRQMESDWRGFLAGLTRAAVDKGQLRADLDIDQFVWELAGIYLSHHAAQRFLKSPDADARAARAFESLLKRSQSTRGS